MGRIRTIKPEILTDEKSAALSHPAWRLWVSMLVLADDAGRLPAAAGLLGGQVFWGQPADVQAALNELAGVGLIKLYAVRGQQYALINGFAKHQKIDRASGPKHPGPEQADEGSSNARRALESHRQRPIRRAWCARIRRTGRLRVTPRRATIRRSLDEPSMLITTAITTTTRITTTITTAKRKGSTRGARLRLASRRLRRTAVSSVSE
jgi:hypothetical protein